MKRILAKSEAIGIPYNDYIRWVLKRACPPDLEENLTTSLDWTPSRDQK